MKIVSEINLHHGSTTLDVIKYLELAHDDDDLQQIVDELDMQGKALFGPNYGLRFDPTVPSRDFRRRIFLTRPKIVSATLIPSCRW